MIDNVVGTWTKIRSLTILLLACNPHESFANMSSEIPNLPKTHQEWLAGLIEKRHQKFDEQAEKLPKQSSSTESGDSDQDIQKVDAEIREATAHVHETKYLALLTKCTAMKARERLLALEARRLSLLVRLECKEKENAQKLLGRSTREDKSNGTLEK